jgi:hypothetical protein
MMDRPLSQQDPVTGETSGVNPEPPQRSQPRRAAFVMAAIIFSIAIVYCGFLLYGFFHPVGTCCGTRIIALSAQQENNHTLTVTYRGGSDAYALCGLHFNVTDSNGQSQEIWAGQKGPVTPRVFSMTGNDDPGIPALPAIGQNVTFSGNFSGKDHIWTSAYFNDGKHTIVMDTDI